MQDMRIKKKTLQELVNVVTGAEYKQECNLRIGDKTWMVYTKEGSEVVNAVYVSNFNDMLYIQTFKETSCRNEVEDELKRILGKYEGDIKHIAEMKEKATDHSIVAGFIGLVGSGLATRMPAIAVVASILTGIIYRFYRQKDIKMYKEGLQKYLDQRQIKLGSDVMGQMYAEKRAVAKTET